MNENDQELLDRLTLTMETGGSLSLTGRKRGPWREVLEFVPSEGQAYAYWARMDDEWHTGHRVCAHPDTDPSELDLDLYHLTQFDE